MQLSRRSFMAFLTAAPFVFDPNRKIFDMGRSKIWTPPPPQIITGFGVSMTMGDWIELGPYIDRSIAMMMANFGEQMDQTIVEVINGNSQQEFLRKIDRIASR